MKRSFPRNFLVALASASLFSSTSQADVIFSEDFDGGGVNSVFAFTNTGGDPAAVVDSTIAANAMVAQITSLSTSNNNSIAFDAFSLTSVQARITFDFRMTTDAENTGCCGQAADGFGIGIFDTGVYGTMGAINPTVGTANWEDPNTGEGFPGAVVLGFDIFDSGDGIGNHVRINGVGGPADSLGSFLAPFELNTSTFHRAVLIFNASGANSILDVELIEDVNGAATTHAIASGIVLTGVDLAAVNARVIAGGRTGGAFVQTQLDNIVIETFQGDDSDFDGIPDFWEEQNGLDKDDPEDFDDDPDGDMLSNIDEFTLGSDPQDGDTDDDTLSDLVETNTGMWVSEENRGTNPRAMDSDLDGLNDNVENNSGTFTNAMLTGTNPNIADTDEDTFSDGDEVAAETDPTDANSFPATPAVLGIGTGFLLGGDLTDPENDGAPDSDVGYNAVFRSSEEPGFAGGEFAFNVFDNFVGGGNDKWCCGSEGGTFPAEPIWIEATFEDTFVLTHFTIASANDTVGRDPRVWEIQGSNDGVNYDTIHREDDPSASVWGIDRNEVLQWTAGTQYAQPAPYSTFRFICFATGLTTGARYQISEIEFFGVPGNLLPFSINSIVLNEEGTQSTITWNSRETRTYAVDFSLDMTGEDTWEELDDGVEGQKGTTSFSHTFPKGAERVFYRVREGE